jgi:hypothetical protein
VDGFPHQLAVIDQDDALGYGRETIGMRFLHE